MTHSAHSSPLLHHSGSLPIVISGGAVLQCAIFRAASRHRFRNTTSNHVLRRLWRVVLTSEADSAAPTILQIMVAARELAQTVPARGERVRCAAASTAALDRRVVIDLHGGNDMLLLVLLLLLK